MSMFILKKNRVFISILLSVVFSGLILSCAGKNGTEDYSSLKESMIRFDQAFIPALALTNKGDMRPSQKAMSILSDEWESILDGIDSTYSADENLQKSFDLIGDILGFSQEQLKDGKDLMAIHETLELAKDPFKLLRSAKGIDYPLDLIDNYHTTMEEMIDLVHDKDAKELSSTEIQTLTEHAILAVEQWQKIKSSQIDYLLYGFNENKVEKLNTNIDVGLLKAQEFLTLLGDGDVEGAVMATKQLKSYYKGVYLMFGDFERVKK